MIWLWTHCCFEVLKSNQLRLYWILTVHNSECSVNATASEIVVICTVVFTGSVSPVVECVPGSGYKQKSFDTMHNSVTYRQQITDWHDNDTIEVTCQTTVPGFSAYANSWTFYVVRSRSKLSFVCLFDLVCATYQVIFVGQYSGYCSRYHKPAL